jgi:hypothetical protein
MRKSKVEIKLTIEGTAAIAGQLLGLNNFQMKNAFGLKNSLIKLPGPR